MKVTKYNVAIDTGLHIVNIFPKFGADYHHFKMWWGFSQALDLVAEFKGSGDKKKGGGDGETCNVLLVGQCDGRHMLKTIAQKYQHQEDLTMKIYVYEPLLENVARELLFTLLSLEPPEHLGIGEKTLFFMELYGNTLLRPATSKYLTKVSKRLLNMITNINYAKEILPTVSLDGLKYKERDKLEVILKYWAKGDKSFDILKAWDERLRKKLGVRYDSRFGVYDWDYHMRYHCLGADALHIQEYKKFREKGISFHFEDTDPCIPNCTLASAIFSSGAKILSYGYLGDIVTGPYTTFGLICKDEEMFKKVNGQMIKKATDVTERNMTRIFHEIQHQSSFVVSSDIDSGCVGVVLEDTSSKLKIQDNSCSSDSDQIKIKDACEVYQSLGTNNCRIIFMSTTALSDYANKSEYENFFDMAFVCQAMALKYIKPEMIKMLRPDSKVIIDTPKFLLNYRKEDREKFGEDLEKLMNDCNCKLVKPYDTETDEFIKFKVNK